MGKRYIVFIRFSERSLATRAVKLSELGLVYSERNQKVTLVLVCTNQQLMTFKVIYATGIRSRDPHLFLNCHYA